MGNELPCDNCMHRAVCCKYKASDHIGPCNEFDEDRPQTSKWDDKRPVPKIYYDLCELFELHCKDCGKYCVNLTTYPKYDFCPHCGADMREASHDS